jgi:methionyl-tRNA formyltransferase
LLILGTGDFALPTFVHLHETGHELLALITQPDRPQGRKQELIPSRIKRAAQDRGIPVEQPEDVNAAESLERVRSRSPDLVVTAAYGQILSAELLSIARLGGINLHGSVLPAYRGAAPVARAIEQGENETGVTVIQMSPRIDAGGMIAVARTPIGPDETAGELEDRLAELGAPLVAEAIAALAAGTARIEPQEKAKATRAPKLRKEDGRIDWTRPAQAVHNLVRAMQPWPAAYTHWLPAPKPPVRLIVHKTTLVNGTGNPGEVLEAEGERLVVAAGMGAVSIIQIQAPSKRAMGAGEFLRGNRVARRDRFGDA